jgi:hypothetical protein
VKIWTGFRLAVFGAAVLLLTAVSARADFVTAYGWVTTEAIAGSATGASAASLALSTCHMGTAACTTANADVTFTTTGVNFSATGANIATWLASSPFLLNNLVDSVPNTLMDATIWMFVGDIKVTGTAGSPESFTITHDDGATFVVNGQTVIDAPGPTAPVVTTGSYTGGASGNAPFELIYAECCGGPAVLQVSLLAPEYAPVPDGGVTLILLGGALAGLETLRRRFRA